ncbi:MAG: dihydroorotate dehydrogenase [Desulfosarcinaceae bacterium]|nr:dihydroorotate dehydrogenase [Desulfosarcinaceae bacterium]
MSVDLSVNIGGLHLKNPVLTASGTFGYGREFSRFMDLNALGGIVVKGLSLEPSRGNPPPRVVETASGMLNAIGLENVGLAAFIKDKLPYLRTLDTAVIVNIYGQTVEAYAELAERLSDCDGIAALEVNISCPNVKAGGIAFGADPQSAHAVVAAVRTRSQRPLWVKLSPNVTDVTTIARSAADAGADALSLINTLTGMAIDVETRRPVLANVTGGLSGPAIKPVALRMVWQAAQAVDLPIVGIGGIMNTIDALEFLIAGAAAIQVGTANFINPSTAVEIVDGLTRYCEEGAIRRLSQLTGSLVTSARE